MDCKAAPYVHVFIPGSCSLYYTDRSVCSKALSTRQSVFREAAIEFGVTAVLVSHRNFSGRAHSCQISFHVRESIPVAYGAINIG